MNVCTADKIASDPECYEWAKSNPNSMARFYFCQQQFRDPLCVSNESFSDNNPTNENPSTSLWLIILIAIISIVIVTIVVLRKNKQSENNLKLNT